VIEVRDLVYRYGDAGDGGNDGGSGGDGDDRDDGDTKDRGIDGESRRDEPHPNRAAAVLRGVTLSIPDGSFLALAGPNGSGKTTLVRQFNGLLEPDSGEVLVNGIEVGEGLVAARSAVAMTFQNPRDAFVASTVGPEVAFGPENLGLDRSEIDQQVERALSAVGMGGREHERLTRLSGGEQARVSVASALAMEPDHLVLDEPFAGLDWPARERLLDRLVTLHEAGTGVIVVSHDLTDLLDPVDRIVVLADGRVAADGPPEEVRDRLPALGVRDPASSIEP
jgi:biotin transport system ATP-binding protein